MARTPPSDYPASATTQPAGNALAITPADSDLSIISRAIYVGTAGNLTVKMAGSENTVTFAGVSAGSLLPIRVTQVLATNTTATNIVALY
jgi:hypothetical protein